jgi:hypothetical protein
MGVHGRQEFFYSRVYTGFTGSLLLIIGTLFLWGALGHFTGLISINFDGSTAAKPYILAGALIAGIGCVAFGLRYLSRSCDPRPVIVVDSEGLLYRDCGDMPVPWQEIRAVELVKDDDNNCVVLTRRGAPACCVAIDVRYLAGSGTKDLIYHAILNAWKRHSSVPKQNGTEA